MTSYSITCNSYMMSLTAHLQDSNLLSFITQCLTQSLQSVGTDHSFTTCMSQHCKVGNMICTENIYTDTNKVDMQT